MIGTAGTVKTGAENLKIERPKNLIRSNKCIWRLLENGDASNGSYSKDCLV